MTKRFLQILFIFNFYLSFGQFHCDSIFLYKNFNQRGTTASVYSNFIMLDTSKTEKVKLTNNDLQTIREIFSSLTAKKFIQTKHGDIYYTIIWDKGKKHNCAIENKSLIDFTIYRKYIIIDSADIRTLHDILEKNWY
jgi:hypothetical protein